MRDMTKAEMEYQFKVENSISDDAMHYANVEQLINQGLEEGWSAEECAHQCEMEV